MIDKGFASTFDALTKLEVARTPAELCAALLKETAGFGVEKILAGLVPKPSASAEEQANGVLLADWPNEWAQRYFARNYLFDDPTIDWIQTKHTLLFWDDLRDQNIDASPARKIMHEASDFGLVSGYTAPIISISGSRAGVSFAGRQILLSHSDKTTISLLGTYALLKAAKLRDASPPAHKPKLTPRQLDAIKWAAEGKTDWEIGTILGISEHGADKLMRQIRERLMATSRVHAVAKAIRLKLIA